MKPSAIFLSLVLFILTHYSHAQSNITDVRFAWIVKNKGNINITCSVTDRDGNTYVSGSFKDTCYFENIRLISAKNGYFINCFFLAKYSSTGKLLWIKQGNGHDVNEAFDIALSSEGKLLVLVKVVNGFSYNGIQLMPIYVNQHSAILLNCDTTGKLIQHTTIGNPAYVEYAQITTDDNGNCYIAGRFGDGEIYSEMDTVSASDFTIFYLKVNVEGKISWVKSTKGGDGTIDDIIYDHNGSIWMAARFTDEMYIGNYHLFSKLYEEGFVAKLKPDGTPIYASMISGTSADSNFKFTGMSSLACDHLGNLYVAGMFVDSVDFGILKAKSLASQDGFLLKYNSVGQIQWAKVIQSYVDEITTIFSIGKDAIYTRTSYLSNWKQYAKFEKYNFDGDVQLQISLFNQISIRGMGLDKNENFYVAGNYYPADGNDGEAYIGSDTLETQANKNGIFLLRKDTQQLLGIAEEDQNKNIINQYHIYPNPVANSEKVHLLGLIDNPSTLQLYNITGTLEKSWLVNNQNSTLTIGLDVRPGIYFYKVIAKDNIKFSGKLIILE